VLNIRAEPRRHLTPIGALAVLLVLAACYVPPQRGELREGNAAPSLLPADSLRLGPTDLYPGRSDIRVGMAPVLDRGLMVTQYEPLTSYLSTTLGVPVRLDVADSYLDLVERVVDGRVDLAILPPASFTLARARDPRVRILASQIAAGATSYSSYLVVRASADFTALRDLAGQTVSLADEASASGFYLPWAAFLDAGIDPARDLVVRLAGSHTAALRDVIEGRAAAAATYSGMLGFARRELAGFESESADLRILHKAGRLPGDALCATPDLPTIVADKAAAALMWLDSRSPVGARVYALTNNQVSGWGPPTVERYEALATTMKRVDLARSGAHR
jgi:phosphonate transport system substrate-binding protein